METHEEKLYDICSNPNQVVSIQAQKIVKYYEDMFSETSPFDNDE
jgi:hypothetical protein